jgi:hypothetical protein
MHGHKGRGICQVAIHVVISGSNFAERTKDAVRRIHLPRTPVNKGMKKDRGPSFSYYFQPRPFPWLALSTKLLDELAGHAHAFRD